MTDQAKADFKPEDLAAALKRRIDPADLYNVTIRPVPGDPPRVEIILPTGGRQQSAERGEGLAGAAQGQVKDEVPADKTEQSRLRRRAARRQVGADRPPRSTPDPEKDGKWSTRQGRRLHRRA